MPQPTDGLVSEIPFPFPFFLPARRGLCTESLVATAAAYFFRLLSRKYLILAFLRTATDVVSRVSDSWVPRTRSELAVSGERGVHLSELNLDRFLPDMYLCTCACVVRLVTAIWSHSDLSIGLVQLL